MVWQLTLTSRFTHYRSGTASLSAVLQCCGITLGRWSACSMMTESSSLEQMIPPSGTVYSDGWGCDGEGVMVRGVWWWGECDSWGSGSVTVDGMGVWHLEEDLPRSKRCVIKIIASRSRTLADSDYMYSHLLCTIDLVVKPSKPVVVRRRSAHSPLP